MEFLKSFSDTVFQVFPDKGTGYAKVFERYDEAEFKRLNKDGYGIYFTPNGFKGGRKAENLVSINAVYADLDVAKEGGKGNKQPIIKALLTDKLVPNFIIDTKNGVQAIWLIEKTTNKDLCVKVMKGIIEWSKKFGCMGDKVYDLTRVLRLPDYYHMKGEPYMCTAEKHTDDILPIEFMEEAFPYEEKVTVQAPVENNYKKNDVSLEIDRLDFEELIIRAFASVGRTASFTPGWQLVLDGRKTGTHRGKTGDCDFLASNSHEPFVGNRITATADILGVTNKEARAWIVEEYGLKRVATTRAFKKAEAAQEENSKEGYAVDEDHTVYTWGTEGLDREITPIEGGQLNFITGSTGMGKTTFSFFVAMANAKLGRKVLYLSLEQSASGIKDRLARTTAGIPKWEWRDRKTIPEKKKRMFREKIDELNSLENLELYGFGKNAKATLDNIFHVIEDRKPDLVFIDNFDDIALESSNEYAEQNSTVIRLKDFAQGSWTPLCVLHHRNSKSLVKGIGQARGSGKISDTAWSFLKCWRDWVPGEKKDNATFMVQHEKDRNFGTHSLATIYWQNGTFHDTYTEEPTETAFWQNK